MTTPPKAEDVMSDAELASRLFLLANVSEWNNGDDSLLREAARALSRPATPPEGLRERVFNEVVAFAVKHNGPSEAAKSYAPAHMELADAILALLPLSPAAQARGEPDKMDGRVFAALEKAGD